MAPFMDHSPKLVLSATRGVICADEQGDAMRLRCKCSQVSVYGAFRRNHGMYTGEPGKRSYYVQCELKRPAQLDDVEVKTMSGFSQDAIIQGLLYSQSGLDPTVEHTLVSVLGSTYTAHTANTCRVDKELSLPGHHEPPVSHRAQGQPILVGHRLRGD